MIDTSKEQPAITHIPPSVFHRLLDFAETAARHITSGSTATPGLTNHPTLVEARNVAASLPPHSPVKTVFHASNETGETP